MSVRRVNTVEEWNDIVQNNETIIVDVFGNWCPPCKMMSPVFEKHAHNCPEVAFVQLDIDNDAIKEVIALFKVTSLPMFRVVFNKIVLENPKFTVVGADKAKLDGLVENARQKNLN